MSHNKKWSCIKPDGDGCDGNHTLNLDELEKLARAATLVSHKWQLDHDDTYVGAQKIPEENDWYWITGSMKTPEDVYNAECEDEDMRGPTEVVKTHCRYIASINPETTLALIADLRACVAALATAKKVIEEIEEFSGWQVDAHKDKAQIESTLASLQSLTAKGSK